MVQGNGRREMVNGSHKSGLREPVPGRELLRIEVPIFSLPCRFYAQKFSTSRANYGLQLTVVVRNNHPAGPNP